MRLLAHPRFFVLFARREGYAHKIRVGEYTIDPQTTPRQLLDSIVNGKVVMRKMTLVEGVTMRQIRQMLASDDALEHIAVNQTDQEIMAVFRPSGTNHWRVGFFLILMFTPGEIKTRLYCSRLISAWRL